MINFCVDTIDNPTPVHLIAHQLKRVNAAGGDFSPTLSVQNERLSESLTSVTLTESTLDLVNQLYQKKYSLIDERNRVLASFLYQFNPFGKKRLTKIDKQIDIIDEKIYSIESQDLPSEKDLHNIVEKAQRRFDLLTKKGSIPKDDNQPDAIVYRREL
ncbi:hypothetical protein SDB03_14285 [Legionella pneumophila serogroup 1]